MVFFRIVVLLSTIAALGCGVGADAVPGSDGGSELAASDGGSVAGTDGGSVAGTDGGSVAGTDGGSVAGTDGGSVAGTDGGSVAGANTPGTYTHTLTVDGMAREVIVYVPEAARGSAPAPAVFMFHGTSGTGEKFYNISRWREKADETGLIAVFPTALTYCYKEDENKDGDFDDRGERKISTKWAAGKLGNPEKMPLCSAAEIAALPAATRALVDHPLMDDLAFVRAMLDLLGASYSVDRRKIYASGFSNGAEFTSRLVLEMSDRFAAAGIGSGGLGGPGSPVRPLSVIHFFGSEDDRATDALGVSPIPVGESLFTDVPAIRDYFIAPFLKMLQLGDEYTYEAHAVGADKTAATFVFAQSTAGESNRYRFVLFEGMAHVYPNGSNYPVAAADFLWELFKTQSLPE